MSDEFIKNAKVILNNPGKLAEFADLNRLTVGTVKAILETLLEQPQLSENVKEYIFSSERSEDFKGYVAGEETGYVKGHDTGFARGVAATSLLLLTLAGLAYLNNSR